MNLKCDFPVSKCGFTFDLHRYIEVALTFVEQLVLPFLVGLYKLNPVDPQLESAWCQPSSL